MGFPRDVLAKTGHLERLQAAVRENRLVQGRDAERTLDLFLSLFTRGAAASLRDDNIDALAIADSVDRFQLPADTSDHVTAVVIQNLPIPNDTTSWDDVLDFKSDTRVRMFHSLLRKWIWQHAKGALSLRELAGEIEAETARFEAFMERHRDNVLLGFAKDPDSLLDQS
jgi:hypothetical protein